MTSAIEGRLDGERVTATCRFSVPYVEWGLKDPSVLFLTVGKEVEIDTATSEAEGLVVVDASSGATGNSSRDARMRDVVLESERFPDIRFRPARVVGTLGADDSFRATVEGTF